VGERIVYSVEVELGPGSIGDVEMIAAIGGALGELGFMVDGVAKIRIRQGSALPRPVRPADWVAVDGGGDATDEG
jgi:hypothetical protein